jgi:multiple sugar transport system substrate-binding protein
VLLPSWGAMPPADLAQFTKQTGIKVSLQTLAWDSIHDKVATSEPAGIAPADVTEVDWSWVGQFGAAGWYTSLASWLPASLIQSSQVSPIFKYQGAQIAMPYSIDFRASVINMTDFKKAGIDTAPATWSQLMSDAKRIKAKGIVQYPIGLPLSVTEGGATPWYALTKAEGGQVLTSSDSPAFGSPTSAGGRALSFEAALYKNGLVPPGETSLTDVQTTSLFQSGQIAVLLSTGPGGLAGLVDPSASKVAHDQIVYVPMAGPNGPAQATFGLPEGLGIPKQSAHKGAAAMFIAWWEQRPQLLVSYNNPNMGDLPPVTSVLTYLSAKNKLVDGPEVLRILPTVKPLFSNGTPGWYPQFSTDVATMIQSVVEGKEQVAAALNSLASQARSLQSSG